MKLKYCLYVLAASLTFAVPAHSAEEEHTVLGKHMEEMNDAYKAIRREKDPEKGAGLAREAQVAIAKVFGELPESMKGMPEGPDKAKAAAEFRVMMGKLYTRLAEMEIAFLNNDLEEVQTIVSDLRDMKKEGHDQFMDEE